MNNSDIQRKKLLEGNIPKTVTVMAIPSVIMQIITLIYNTVDTYFISQINKSAAAAVGTVFAIQAVIQAVGFGFGMGVSSLCSRKLGEAKDEEASTYAMSGITGAVLVAAFIGAVGLLFLDPLLKLIGCTDTMLDYGRDYAVVILSFAPMSCAGFVINNVFKAEGHIKYCMYGIVSGAVLNVILDPIFIFALGWDTMGAALATSLSQFLTLSIFGYMFTKGKTVIKLRFRNISKNISVYLQVITTGIPTVFRQGLASFATALLCKQASVHGDATVAAVTIANKCYMLIRNVVLGIGQGTQPVAGYNYGAGLYVRAKQAFGFAIKIGTAVCLFACVIMYGFATEIMWWFCKDAEVLIYGVPALRYAAMVVPVMAFSTFVNQEYQSFGFKKSATILASCRQGICFIPLILILPVFMGATGVEMAQPMADLLTFFISVPFYVSMVRLLNRKEKEKTVVRH